MQRVALKLLESQPQPYESSRARNRRERAERKRIADGLPPPEAIFPSTIFRHRLSRFRLLTVDETEVAQALADHDYGHIDICK